MEPALEDIARELIGFRATLRRAAGVANEGWKLFNETLGDEAGTLANQASEGYRRVTETANDLAGRGREAADEVYGKAKDAVTRGGGVRGRHDAAAQTRRVAGIPRLAGSQSSPNHGA